MERYMLVKRREWREGGGREVGTRRKGSVEREKGKGREGRTCAEAELGAAHVRPGLPHRHLQRRLGQRALRQLLQELQHRQRRRHLPS